MKKEEYNKIDWNRPIFEIERDRILIDVYGSVKFIDGFSDSDKEQLYKFAKIVSNYLKMKRNYD